VPRAVTAAKFPASLVALADVGLFTNVELLTQDGDIASGATVITFEQAVGNFAVGMYLATRGRGGFEVVRVTAVDLNLKQLTVVRAQDGTLGVAHYDGQTWWATVPALGLNQMRDDLIAVETALGANNFIAGNADRVLFLGAAGSITTDADFQYASDQLRLAGQGSATGVLLGGDAQWFRGAANRMDLASGDDLNIVLGNLQMAAVTLFESDRDLAITLLPNADASLDLGSSSRRWDQVIGNNIEVYGALGDTQPLYRLSNGGLRAGPGGATTPTTVLARIADNIWEVLGAVAGDVRLGLSAAGNAFASLRAAAADAQPYALWDNTGLSMGPGGATAPRVRLSEGVANRWDMNASVGLNLVDGAFLLAGVVLFENDRDLAVTLLPNADAAIDLGSAARRFDEGYINILKVLNAASEANALYQLDANGLRGGPGGASALDVTQARHASSTWKVTGAIAGDVRWGMSGAATPYIEGRLATADAQPAWQVTPTGYALGAGGASAPDLIWQRGGANEWETPDNVDVGSLLVGGVQVIEADRDVAIPLLPNASGALDVGSNTRRWRWGYLTDGIDIFEAGGVGVGFLEGTVKVGGNGATLGAALTYSGFSSGRAALSNLNNAGGTGASIDLGFGAFDTATGRPTLRALSVYQDGSVDVVAGAFQIGGVTLFESDRDLAITLLPNADASLDLGSAVRRFDEAFINDLKVLNAASDANPLYRLSSAGLTGGAGGASAVDVSWARGAANRWDVGANDHIHLPAGDVRFDNATKGVILKDTQGTPHYWRVTVANDGSLVTTDLGTSLPAT
jgi:hypothetical protein